MLHPRASMSLLMWEIILSHSSSSEGTDWSSELPAAPLPLVVEVEAVLSVLRYLPKLSVMMPRPSFTPMVSRKFSKCWLSFSGMKGRRPAGRGGEREQRGGVPCAFLQASQPSTTASCAVMLRGAGPGGGLLP